MLISDEYRALNAQLHVEQDGWGRQAIKNWDTVKGLADDGGHKKILDYGCGKGMLGVVLRSIGYEVIDYDPSIPGKDTPPEPCGFGCCLDVLEHVEPECVDAVIADLARVTKEALFVIVATRPSSKTMPDGSNPHRTVEPCEWWLTKFRQHFVIGRVNEKPGRVFAALLVSKQK